MTISVRDVILSEDCRLRSAARRRDPDAPERRRSGDGAETETEVALPSALAAPQQICSFTYSRRSSSVLSFHLHPFFGKCVLGERGE